MGKKSWRELCLLSNQVKRTEIIAGDHVYSWRFLGTYAHHGIYVGEGVVIHFTAPPEKLTASIADFTPSSLPGVSSFESPAPGKKPCPNIHPRCGSQKPGSGVAISCLTCFVHKGSLYRFEYGVTEKAFPLHRGGTCTTDESGPKSIVVQRANYRFEIGFGNYDLVKNNCEDFSIYCKTGLYKGLGRSGQIAFLVKIFPKIAAKRRYAADIGIRDDVIYVQVEKMDEFHRDRGLVADNSTDQDDKNDLQDCWFNVLSKQLLIFWVIFCILCLG